LIGIVCNLRARLFASQVFLFSFVLILIGIRAYSLPRADQLLLNKLLLKDDAKVRRACAQPSKNNKEKKLGGRGKRKEKRNEKREKGWKRERKREIKRRWFSRRITSLVEIGSSEPGTCSAGPNWRGSRGLFASRLQTGVHYRSRWWSWLQLPPTNTCLFLRTAIGIPMPVLFAATHSLRRHLSRFRDLSALHYRSFLKKIKK